MKIGDREYLVPTPPGMRSFALQQRIWPVAARLGAALAPLIPAWMSAEKLSDLDVAELAKLLPQSLPLLGEVFAAMAPGELEGITRELLRDAKCNGAALFGSQKGDAFDGLMQGRTMETWKLLLHAMEVWYPDFFGGARGLLALRSAKESPSAGSSTSETAGEATG